VRISHKVDYGVRVLTALATIDSPHPTSREHLAGRLDIPSGFLDDILRQLRNGGLTRSHRGADGGWSLAKQPADITVADIIRVLEGPLASVRGVPPNELATIGIDEPYVSLWVGVRAALRSVLEVVTVADLASGRLPPSVVALTEQPDAWKRR
jgi:Rrf2 family protein